MTTGFFCLKSHWKMPGGWRHDQPKLLHCFNAASSVAEVARQLPADSKIHRYRDFPENPKPTYPWEKMSIAQALKEKGL